MKKKSRNRFGKRFVWPSNSADCNLIENVWSDVERRLDLLHERPSKATNLFQLVRKLWYETDNKYISNFYGSMDRRLDVNTQQSIKTKPTLITYVFLLLQHFFSYF